MGKFTLCWDCAKATGMCPWSKRSKPVEGWEAEFVPRNGGTKPYDTYVVIACPLFERDSYDYGLHRKPRIIKLDP